MTRGTGWMHRAVQVGTKILALHPQNIISSYFLKSAAWNDNFIICSYHSLPRVIVSDLRA